ncbi:MAG: hydroxysqualene dehydroxylase HpnE [Gemmataceae bacterium]|jgi:squalene-associated FAD-dependent desaturase|nr:hydroxysqualene dehydroxylase HpnE [Gemmataceae bacterium]
MQVVVIGGGLAGLAATVALARRGVAVTLLEARPRLGGRAGSFRDTPTGQWLDVCQHVAMGCCTQLLQFFRTVGLQHYLVAQPRLVFLTPEGRHSYFQAACWPAPFHLSRALLAAHYLTPGDKIRILRGLAALLRCDPDEDVPLEPWLRTHGQTDRTLARFWNTVLVSALNEPCATAGRKYARKVFVEGFLQQRDGWRVHLPIVPLERLYGSELQAFFARHGVRVRLQAAVRRLLLDPLQPRVAAVELRDASRLQADHYILAVPFYRLPDLLPPSLFEQFPVLDRIRQLETAPITSLHLWFDRPVLPWPHAVVVGGVSQWLFRRPFPAGVALNGTENFSPENSSPSADGHSATVLPSPQQPAVPPAVSAESHYLQVVISASTAHLAGGHADLQQRVVQELRQLLPAARTARLLHARVITEHQATFRPVPGVDRWRPPQASPLSNLALAGDWTATGWPATMESAVRSGYLAAQVVLQRAGEPS